MTKSQTNMEQIDCNKCRWYHYNERAIDPHICTNPDIRKTLKCPKKLLLRALEVRRYPTICRYEPK